MSKNIFKEQTKIEIVAILKKLEGIYDEIGCHGNFLYNNEKRPNLLISITTIFLFFGLQKKLETSTEFPADLECELRAH